MLGFVAEAARLMCDLADVRMEICSRGIKLSSLKEVVDETAAIKRKIEKLVPSLTNAKNHSLFMDAFSRKREPEMGLLKKREKILYCSVASVKKEVNGIEVENPSPLCSCGNVDERTMALENGVGLVVKVVAESVQHNVMQLARLVALSFLKHWRQLVEQAR